MHGPIHVKSPNNISKWQMGFNSTFKELINPAVFCKLFEKEKDFVSTDRKRSPNETQAFKDGINSLSYLVIIDLLLLLIACSEQRG
jgi:hypothetical protein